MAPPVLVSGLLTAQEARSLRAEMEASPSTPAKVHQPEGVVVDRSSRSTTYAYVSPQTVDEVRRRMTRALPRSISGLGMVGGGVGGGIETGSPGFLVYRRGDHFTAHTDVGYAYARRRVSMSLFIDSDAPGEDALRIYDGDPDAGPVNYWPIAFEPGLLVAFPSTAYHEVMPVTAPRFTAVAWFLG